MEHPAFDVSRARRAPRRTARRLHSLSDETLIDEARRGERESYGELWRRHSKAAHVAARSFRHLDEPDDLVAEAFANIYQALTTGSGPTTAFRPYLYVTIRNLASRRLRDTPVDGDVDLDALPAADADSAEALLERGITATAFRSLPERWQTVLWYTEVEGLSPRQAGELMGLVPNAVSALSFRARAALREAWVQGHIDTARVTGSHREVLSKLGGWSLGTLSQRDERLVGEHLQSCTRCRLVAEELDDVSRRLAVILLPLVLGGAAALAFRQQLARGAAVAAAPRAQLSVATFTSLGARRVALVGGAAVVVVGAALVISLSSAAPQRVRATGDAAASGSSSAAGPSRGAGSADPGAGSTAPAAPLAPGDPAVFLPAPPASVVDTRRPPSTTAVPALPSPGVTSKAQPVTPPGQPTRPVTPPTAPPTTPTQPGTAPSPVVTSGAVVLTRLDSTTVTGTAPAGTVISVSRDGAAAGSVAVTAQGTWTWFADGLAEGRRLSRSPAPGADPRPPLLRPWSSRATARRRRPRPSRAVGARTRRRR
ncbi:hypothetical protein GCM10025867_20140 [Frondihabitans sucicola]|uniref:RNA polymerase sigma-70 region 2 domain-containing protein n=1 Tax=Frondihabitans sucicola TaxID=1268041 RepID=A0ABN6Y193_9MICO|nr:sigma-70 family RNA polymerase sigma factor [Frondihabitans sucicola]BDZ49773.1 hypothetical protein GCM10025867_20140 [Frondihabitans sucicola]